MTLQKYVSPLVFLLGLGLVMAPRAPRPLARWPPLGIPHGCPSGCPWRSASLHEEQSRPMRSGVSGRRCRKLMAPLIYRHIPR